MAATTNNGIQNLVKGFDGSFTRGLKMPILSSNPGPAPGDFGVSGSSVKVRLADQSILTLGGAPPVQDWESVLAAGRFSGNITPTINGGSEFMFVGGIRIGGGNTTTTVGSVQSIAIGSAADASGIAGIAVGINSKATGGSSLALGDTAQALHSTSIAFGPGAITTQANQIMFGLPLHRTEIRGSVVMTDLAANTTNMLAINQLGASPLGSPQDGSICLDASFPNGRLWVRVSGTWRFVDLT
jgi:hypothetical protein